MKYTMQDYIEQSYEVCIENLNKGDSLIEQLLLLYNEKKPKTIWLIASGSSYNACCCAIPFVKKCMESEVQVITPYTFVYYTPKYDCTDLFIVVTQSGISTNAIEALIKLKNMNQISVCLTGNPGSRVKDIADYVIDYGVGEELVGYVTKGVTTLCVFLMIFAIKASKKEQYLEDIYHAIELSKIVKEKSYKFIEEHYKDFSGMSVCYCCGSGSSHGVTLEAALKVGETIHVPSIAYEVEEYIHGPNLQLNPRYTIIFLDSNDLASKRIESIYLATKEVSDHTFMISCNENLKEDSNVLWIPSQCPEDCSSLVELPFVQLISHMVNSQLNSSKQHPLMKKFKKIAMAKTSDFVNYDEDD